MCKDAFSLVDEVRDCPNISQINTYISSDLHKWPSWPKRDKNYPYFIHPA